MFYYLYEIRNNLNGKIYVGVHKTKNMEDGYMGSGKVIRSAIAKHGIENFTKVILGTFETSEEMYAAEAELVTEEFLARDDVYNLRRGGHGGFDYINSSGLSGSRIGVGSRLALRSSPSWQHLWKSKQLAGVKLKNEFNKENKLNQWADDYVSPFRNPTIQKEMTERARAANLGSMWITNELENKKIKKDSEIPLGWRKGRI